MFYLVWMEMALGGEGARVLEGIKEKKLKYKYKYKNKYKFQI